MNGDYKVPEGKRDLPRSNRKPTLSSSTETKQNLELRLKSLDYTVNVAEKNLEMQLYVSAAFYIHLSVEKALKVAIVSLNEEFPQKTHRLQRLYAEIQDKVVLTEEQIEFLEELTSVAVSARYEDIELTDPSEIYTKSVVEEYMQKALPIIEKLRASVQS